MGTYMDGQMDEKCNKKNLNDRLPVAGIWVFTTKFFLTLLYVKFFPNQMSRGSFSSYKNSLSMPGLYTDYLEFI